jgi:hypothetical protein
VSVVVIGVTLADRDVRVERLGGITEIVDP